MSKSNEFCRIRKERMGDIGKCELCGSKRGLELHHCIPCSLGGDTEDNLILVCAGCHAKLTPKSALTKLGLRNRIYNIKMSFYKWVGEFIDAGEKPDTDDFFDFIENLEEILAGNKEV